MLRAMSTLVVVALPVLVACTTDIVEATRGPAPSVVDTIKVGRAHREVTVTRTEDSVTVVLISERGRGVTVVDATYDSGPTFRIWVTLRDVTVSHLPWHPGGLRFGNSEAFHTDRGDVLVLRFPEDLRDAGLLGRMGRNF